MKKEIESWGLADYSVYATGVVKKSEVVTSDELSRNSKGYFSLSRSFLEQKR